MLVIEDYRIHGNHAALWTYVVVTVIVSRYTGGPVYRSPHKGP